MMDFVINGDELEAMYGLSHIQQLTYLRGIRPYMDVKTGLVGIKRGISYQSISEQLYVNPHQGIKSQKISRDQVRRAVLGLVRAGMIEAQSEGMQLILKCLLATKDFSVQNKAAINPPQKATLFTPITEQLNIGISEVEVNKAAIVNPLKAAIPLYKDNYYIYLLAQFEQFWSLYPEKKSKSNAQAAFEQLNPTAELFQHIMHALHQQLQHRSQLKAQGTWVPPWKYPANWLTNRSWEDELFMDVPREKYHAQHEKNTRANNAGADLFCPPCDEEESRADNVLSFQRYQ